MWCGPCNEGISFEHPFLAARPDGSPGIEEHFRVSALAASAGLSTLTIVTLNAEGVLEKGQRAARAVDQIECPEGKCQHQTSS